MNTMLVTMTLDPARSDEVERHFRDDVAPWATRQPGFVSGQWLSGGVQGFGIVVFDSQEHADAAAVGPRSAPSVEGRAWNTDSVVVFDQVAKA
ncbi:MAG TPA: hypothetical protein VGL75_00270 [Acidothermaceae bacterium]|jgi:hypothetical protein